MRTKRWPLAALLALPAALAAPDALAQNQLLINDVALLEGNSGTTVATFTVTLVRANCNTTVGVLWSTANGSALAGSDYQAGSGTLSFPPPALACINQTRTLQINISGDTTVEPDESFFINLTNATNATIIDAQGVGTITNDDAPPVVLSINDVSVQEGNTGSSVAIFTISATPPPPVGAVVSVSYATADGTATAPADYSGTQGNVGLTIQNPTATVRVTVAGDTLDEADNDTFFVNLSGAQGGTIGDGQGVGTIIDDDPLPSLTITDVTVTEGNAGTVLASFGVTLSPQSGRVVTVSYATANDTAAAPGDYVATSGTLTFPPAAPSGTQNFTVTVNADTLDEINEQFRVNLSGAVNAVLADSQGVGTITDDDAAPSLNISDVTLTEGNSGTTNANFTISLTAASGQTVTVQWATANGTAAAPGDYTSASGTATFAPGVTTQVVSIPVVGDLMDEADETFTVALSGAVNASIRDGTGQATITDDDATPSFTINDVSVVEGNTGTVNAVFTVSLSNPSGGPVSVSYATQDGTAAAPGDYTALSAGLLTLFSPITSATIIVPVAGDVLDEANETFSLVLSAPQGATIADGTGVATITDDDLAPTLSINDVSGVEGNSGAPRFVFTVSLSAPSGQTVTAGWASANGTATAGQDYTAGSGSVTFPPGTTSVNNVVVITTPDTLNEVNETFLVNLSAPVNATLADGQGVGTIIDDDTAPSILINDVTVTEGNAGTVTAAFTVSLTAPSGQLVTVDYATANGTATAPADYAAASGTLLFTPGTTTQPVNVTVNADLLDELNEGFTVALSNPVAAPIIDGTGAGTITDDDLAPTISVSDVTVTEGNSGTVNAVFNLTLSAPSGQTITAAWATTGGTASAPGDFTQSSGSATFPPGSTSQQVSVPVAGDLVDELNETFTLNLSNVSNVTIADGTGLCTITDDDAPPVLTVSNVTVTEGNAGTVNAVFTLTLSNPSEVGGTTFDYATSNGTAVAPADYIATSGASGFDFGVTTTTILVPVNGDVLDEANETFTLVLSNLQNMTLAGGGGIGTITDDDTPPGLSVADASVLEGNTGAVQLSFTVSLSAPSGQAVGFNWATSNGSAVAPGDYTAGSGTGSIPAGALSTVVNVGVAGDVLDEANETFTLTVSAPSNATLVDGTAVGTITDDDAPPTLNIGDVTVSEGNAGTVNAVFTVSLSAASGQTVSADWASANGTALAGSDYVAGAGALSFTPGSTSQTVTVVVNGDLLDELNETFDVSLTNVVNGGLGDLRGTATITDDDLAPSLSVNDVTVSEGNAGTVNAVFTVSLSAASGQAVSAAWSTADGSAAAGADYAAGSGVVSFTPGSTSQTITVVVNGDLLDEPNETFTVTLSAPTNATLADGTGGGTITDDDLTPSLSINDVTVTEGNAGTVNAVFTVTLSAASGQSVSVDWATSNGSAVAPNDFVAGAGSLLFTAGATTRTLTVVVNADLLDEINEAFSVVLSNVVNATLADGTGGGIITDDDAPPSLSIADLSVVEGNGGTTAAVFTVSLSAASGQTVSVDYATANGTASAPADYTAAAGSLSFPAGAVSRTLTVNVAADALNEVTETFLVNLSNAVNATLLDGQATGTIIDDDSAPSLFVDDVTVTEGNAGTVLATFTLALTSASGQVVSVDWATANGSAAAGADYLAAAGTATFLPGDTAELVSVTVNGDLLDEVNETFLINLTNPVSAPIIDGQGLGTITDDDLTPSLSINDVTVTEGNAGTVNAVFTVTLSAASGQTVTVDWATQNGSAAAPADFTAASGSLSFAPGATTRSLTVVVQGDLLDEINEGFLVNLSNAAAATLADAQGAGTITDDDAPPSLSIADLAVTEGNAGTVDAVLAVSLSAASGQTVTVDWSTQNGAAVAPADYAAASGTLTFAPGVLTQTLTVVVQGDVLDEANETLSVVLSGPLAATLADGTAVLTITDDDLAPALAIADVAVTEGNAGTVSAVLTVSLSAASGQTVSVDWATANGTAAAPGDFAAASGSLSFAPGALSQTVTVLVAGDVLDEANETFAVNLANLVNATLADGTGTVTISDDDLPPALSVNDVTVTEGNAGTVNAVFTVTLSAASGQTVGVDWATQNGTAAAPGDYAAGSGNLSFTPGATTRTVTVVVSGDLLDEAAETFTLALTNATSATLADASGLGTITDDDLPPAIAINDVTVTEGNAGTVNAVFTVSLSAPSGLPISVAYSTAEGTATAGADFVSGAGTLSFTPGAVSQSVSVTVNGDLLDEPSETFFVDLSGPSSATLSDAQGLGSITDDDLTPSLSVADVTVTEGNAGTVNAVFTVSLSAASGQLVTVDYATANGSATAGSDYVAAAGGLSFTPGATSRTVSVTVNGDVLDEPNEAFLLNLTNPLNATLADGQASGGITDDDAPPALSIGDVTVTEGNAGTVSAGFTVSLSAASGQTVTVSWATADGTAAAPGDYGAGSGSLTFAPGVVTQPVAVQVTGDLLDEPNESFSVNLASPVNATLADGTGSGTITDDDATPSLAVADVTVTEGNAGTVNAVFTVSLSAASGQVVTVDFATSNGTALAPADYAAQSGSLSFAAGATSRTVTVLVQGDALDEADEVFSLVLSNAVNATLGDASGAGTITDDDLAPTLSIADVTVTEGNAGTTAALLTVSLSAASGQVVTVDWATTNGTALAGQDYDPAAGSLSFPAGSVTQTFTVNVRGDLLDEPAEAFSAALAGPQNATLADGTASVTITDDDLPPGLSIADVSLAEGNSGTVNAVLAVSLSAPSGQVVTVAWATAAGTAQAGSDFVAGSGTLTFPAGSTSQSLTIVVNADLLDEDDETVFVDLSAPVSATLTDGRAVITITDDDLAPSMAISDVTITEGNGGTSVASFTVSLSGPSGRTVSADFASANGTAQAPADYAAASGALSFPPGAVAQAVDVTVAGDLLDEPNETFTLTLTNVVNALLLDGQATGTITDDDAAPALSINDVTVTEGNAGTVNAVFTVSLSAASGQTVNVDWASSNGTAVAPGDFTQAAGTLSFTPGSLTRTLTVVVQADLLDEVNETFSVTLTNPQNATLADGTGGGSITDDDAPPAIAVADVAVTEGNAGTVNAVFTVTLSAASGQVVTVDYATAGGTATAGADYLPQAGALSFPAGTTSRTVSVPVVGDPLDEPNETFLLNLSNAQNAALSDPQAVGTITDDDLPPNLTVADVSVAEGNAGVTGAAFVISLSAASGQPVSVDFVTADGTALAGSDYTAQAGTVSFPPGTVSQTVVVDVSGDALNEPNEAFTLNLANPVAGVIADGQATGTITNDDALPGLSVSDASVTEGNAGTVNAVFTVSLGAASGQTVSVSWATANDTASAGTDYVAAAGTLSFAPGALSQTVTVQVNGDLLDEANERFLLNLTAPVNAALTDGQGAGTITDDDLAPSLSIDDVSVVEGNSGTVNAVFTVSLSAASGQAVSVAFATANGSAAAPADFTAQSGTLNFAAGVLTRTIAVVVNGDTLNEVNESFSVTLSAPVNATLADGTGGGTILDDDAAPSLSINDVSVNEGNAGSVNATFTVILSAPSGVNVSVDWATQNGSAQAPADYTAGAGTLSFPAGTTSRTLSVAVQGDLLDEVNETFLVVLSNAQNAPLIDAQGQGTISDDDSPPSAAINDVTVVEGNAGSVNAGFTVTLSAPSGQTVTLTYGTADGTARAGADYTAATGNLSFAPGVTSQTVVVPVRGDVLDEPDESFSLNLSNPGNATLADGTGSGTITDDDQPPSLSIADVAVGEGSASSVMATFTVTLSAPSGQVVTVDWATADDTALAGSDYAPGSGRLSFAPGVVSQTLDVAINSDLLDEPDESFRVGLSAPAAATVGRATAAGTILDDDGTPELVLLDLTVAEGDSGASQLTVSLGLSAASGQVVSVDVLTADGSARAGLDYQAGQATLSFTPGTTSQTFTLDILGDVLDEADEGLLLLLSNPVNAVVPDPEASVTILDDDAEPALSLGSARVREGTGAPVRAELVVSLSAPSGRVVSFDWRTLADTAQAGSDFTLANGTGRIPAGALSSTVAVEILGDRFDEPEERLFVLLTGAGNATIAGARGEVLVEDDDQAGDLAVRIEREEALVVGQAGRLRLVVTNAGAGPAFPPFRLGHALPASLTVRSAQGSGWTCTSSAAQVGCAFGAELAATASTAVEVEVEVGPGAFPSVTSTATVELAGDMVPGNDQAVDVARVIGSADLGVAKTRDAATPAVPGARVSYTLWVENRGPNPVTELFLVDMLPAVLGDARFTPSAGSYDPASGLWSGLTLAASSSVALAVDVLLSPEANGMVVNVAVVSPADGWVDPASGNDEARETSAVQSPEDCDPDGLPDALEATLGTDPCDPDTDDDGLCDGAADVAGVCRTGEDKNMNGVVDPGETDPGNADSDGDCLPDGLEVYGSNPTDPLDADTDDDGLCDGAQEVVGVCVAGEDLDKDGVFDQAETNPNDPDTDKGGVNDGEEVKRGTDPRYASDDPLGDCECTHTRPARGARSPALLALLLLAFVLRRRR